MIAKYNSFSIIVIIIIFNILYSKLKVKTINIFMIRNKIIKEI